VLVYGESEIVVKALEIMSGFYGGGKTSGVVIAIVHSGLIYICSARYGFSVVFEHQHFFALFDAVLGGIKSVYPGSQYYFIVVLHITPD
jgi:hypothetical protein